MSRVTSGRYPIVLAAIAILGVAAIATAAILHAMWRDAVEDTQTAIGNVAAILAEQTFQSVRAVDVALGDLVAHVAWHGIETEDDLHREVGSEAQHMALVERLARLAQVQTIAIIDAGGDTVVSSRAWPPPQVNIAEREHFVQLREDSGPALVVGVPVRSMADGDWTVYFGRRLETGAGDFLGAVIIGVPPEFFLNIAEGTSALEGYEARLLREDGTIYVTNPAGDDQLGTPMVEAAAWHDMVAAGGGTFRNDTSPDRPPRYVTVRPVADYPLVVDVAVDEAHVAETWRPRALAMALVSGGLALGVALLVGGLIVQVQRALVRQEQLRDRDERLLREARQRQAADARFETAIAHMRQGLAVFDKDSRLVVCNRAFLEMYGIAPDEAPPGTALQTILKLRIARGVYSGSDPGAYTRERTALGANPELRETTDVHSMRDGRFFRISKQVLPDGGWLAVHEDVTERETTLAHLRYLASHDPLTGLANRTLLLDELDALLLDGEAAKRAGLLLVDLDGFKTVNDKFGHTIGDELLRAVSARLRSLTSENDTVARLGGDEFAILRPCDPAGAPGIVELGTRILESFRSPFEVDPHRLKVGASIGIAAAPEHPASPDQVLRQADLALYRAKSEGRNRVAVFESAMEIAITYRRDLARDLDAALDSATDAAAVTIDYQPIIDVETGKVVAMEALARWRHPDFGPVPPSTFVPIAEEFGLIHRLGEHVLGEACQAAAGWPPGVRVAINVSALQVAHGDLPTLLRRHLARTGLPAGRIELEITETALLADEDRVSESLRELRAMDVQIVLDDFGTGYASLSNLNTFAVDRIKIDRTFIARLGAHRGSTAIVEASTMIAEAFRVAVTAEGVETAEQCRMLRALGVRHLQGYLFARPAPRDAWTFADGKAIRNGEATVPASA